MTMRDPNYDMMIARQGGQLGQFYSRSEPTVDEGIGAIRKRVVLLKSNLENIEAWRSELAKLEAVLKAWGDK